MSSAQDYVFNILLADDDPEDCTLFEEALYELPIRALLRTISNGVNLLQMLRGATANLPDVLFLDLNMPMKSGYECLAEIKEHKKLRELPVIIFSSSSEKEVLNLLYDMGALYYIEKPNVFSHFKLVIHKAILLVEANRNAQPTLDDFLLQP